MPPRRTGWRRATSFLKPKRVKNFFTTVVAWVLKKLAQATISKYRPGVIGVTGSVGKTSAKRAIAAVLGNERKVRASVGNFNNELGLPFTILSGWSALRSFFSWPGVVVAAAGQLIARSNYPEILVLEYGADRPGDMKRLLDIARPNVSVITAIGDVPVHVEFYSGPEEVAREKAKLIEHLPAAGFAILNGDDPAVLALKERTRAHVISFGFGKENEVRITNFENRSEGNRPAGIAFKLNYGGNFVPVRLDGVFGSSQAYAAAAAAAAGIIFGMNLVKISDALKDYRPAPSRMELLPGVKQTYVLDDSYNASPLSMRAALQTLADLPGKRKVAVVGDMAEIGTYAVGAHEAVGRYAARSADLLIAVGLRANFVAEAARKSGMPKRNIFTFRTADEAKGPVQDLIKKGDLILIKASRAMHFEAIVEEIKAIT